jgi:uncharacterized protein (TIGR02117 family)
MTAKILAKRILKYTFKSTLVLIGLILFYLLCVWILPKFERSAEATKDSKTIAIYVKTNGVHTDLVVPIKTKEMDWTTFITYKETKGQDTSSRFIAFGWGDKGFFLETPTWGELKFSTAFKAAFALSTAAIHSTYYKEIERSKTCKKVFVSSKQYKRLVKYIKSSFLLSKKDNSIYIKTKAIYGMNDAFYEATGSYSIFHTCNTWANNGLRACGQKSCFWVALSTPILELF